jgi:hypothetical protein
MTQYQVPLNSPMKPAVFIGCNHSSALRKEKEGGGMVFKYYSNLLITSFTELVHYPSHRAIINSGQECGS